MANEANLGSKVSATCRAQMGGGGAVAKVLAMFSLRFSDFLFSASRAPVLVSCTQGAVTGGIMGWAVPLEKKGGGLSHSLEWLFLY